MDGQSLKMQTSAGGWTVFGVVATFSSFKTKLQTSAGVWTVFGVEKNWDNGCVA